MIDRANRPSSDSVSRRRFVRGAVCFGVLGSVSGCFDVEIDERVDRVDDRSGDEPSEETVTPPDERVAAYERAIHERVNEVRRDRDVDPLAYNEAIATVAREHSADMAEREYFSHESPDGEGPADRLAEFFPGHCRGVGENIANVREEGDPQSLGERVVSLWMDSPGHRENLLRTMFDEEGFGVHVADDRVVVTQKFCATG